MRRGLLVVVLLMAAVGAFANHQSSQNPSLPPPPPGAIPFPQNQQKIPPAPVGKLTPIPRKPTTSPKPIPCSERLKAQVNSNAELSKRVVILEGESAGWHNLANEVTARQRKSIDEYEQILKAKDKSIEEIEQRLEAKNKLIEDQRKLLEQYSAVSTALAGEMMASDVSGNWTIQTERGPLVCYVRVYQITRTIQLTSCH